MEGKIKDPDKALQKGGRKLTYEYDACGNLTAVRADSLSPVKSYLWDEENRLIAANTSGSVSCYFYDVAGERTVKLSGETEEVHVNGNQVSESSNIAKFTAYVSPYFQVSNGGAYTKHIYSGSQRIASKLGNESSFGADPRRVEQAGGLKITDLQADLVENLFAALGQKYEKPRAEETRLDSTADSEEREKFTFFYHPDHLGSTNFVTDIDGNAVQFISYIPYGEVFVEERNSSFSSSYLFNAKELDNETGLYYYGARYLDPENASWLIVDPLWEKNVGVSPYSFCSGNPVNRVDLDGRDDWGLEGSSGKLFLIKETKETSRIILGVRKNRNGDVKGLKYDDDNNLKNKFIDVPNGTLKSIRTNKYNNTTMSVKDKEKAKELFEFLADNTSVEWAWFGNDNRSRITTSHKEFSEGQSGIDIKDNLNENKQVEFHIHNHPYEADRVKREGIDSWTPSDSDIDFMKYVRGLEGGENIRFEIYSNKKYRSYSVEVK